ncbi:hypothetical protein RHMOL_Rhmol02G0151900 [Rhododendron molle]|uniref:Uncharacterized protein n=1 Tax=Rhododendron molle TaxID=49168 RepID=A0ACC0PQ18_RHOML|nr:hypothetical protein RHMOL_Rhmol02G0151900 [Rhododendron molle]
MSEHPSETTGEGDAEEDIFELEDVSQPLKRKRTLRSKVWNHFSKIGEETARCNHCKKIFVASSAKGISHLKNHIEKPTCPILRNKDGNVPKSATPKVAVASFKFDQERSRMDFATMIIKHNYAFNMAEHEFFEIFCSNLQPFKLVSRNTCRADVLNVYEIEKSKLYSFLDELSCKMTLTTDIWTSDHQNFGYICLTVHFITDNWELKKKILAFIKIEYPRDGETLFRFIKDLI